MASGRIQYIGRVNDLKGKSIWEIIGDLKDYGIGRMMIRNMFQRYQEPCYMRVLNVQVLDDNTGNSPEMLRKVRTTVEKTWRGVTFKKPIMIESSTYKPDYHLVAKEDEYLYLNNIKKVQEKVFNKTMNLPPLLNELVKEQTSSNEIEMKVNIKRSMQKLARLAEDGEQSDIKLAIGIVEHNDQFHYLYKDVM